jgi:hypothetical protein
MEYYQQYLANESPSRNLKLASHILGAFSINQTPNRKFLPKLVLHKHGNKASSGQCPSVWSLIRAHLWIAGFSYRMYLLNGARHFLGLTRNLIRRTNFYLINLEYAP